MLRSSLFCAALLLSAAAIAQTSEDIRFPPGDFGTMVTGSVAGNDFVDYRLDAGAGQEMFVDLEVTETDGVGSAYFNLLPPGSTGEAIHIGSIAGNTATIDLPADGTYTIRVYLMGNDRDAGATVDYRIDLSVQ